MPDLKAVVRQTSKNSHGQPQSCFILNLKDFFVTDPAYTVLVRTDQKQQSAMNELEIKQQ